MLLGRCKHTLKQAILLSRGYRKLPRLEDLPDAHLLPTIALVGRPNVGKSALFNRLVHRREALVFDTPSDHVTRDYREGLAQLGDLRFRVIDTSGLEPAAAAHTLQGRAAALTRGVLHSSQGVVMLLDARQGLVPGDEELLSWLRRNNPRPLVLAANKADTRAGSNNLEQMAADVAALGYEPPVGMSATSGDGLADLYQLLQPLVDAGEQQLLKQQQQRQQQQQGARSSHQQQQQQPPHRSVQAVPPLKRQQDSSSVVSAAAAEQEQFDSGEQFDAAAAAAAEEAAVDALLQQHLSSTSAALGSDLSSDDDESEGTFLDPEAAAAAVELSSDDESSRSSSMAVAEQSSSSSSSLPRADSSVQQGPLRLAILGLPNVGKSTLMNTLLGYERSLTGPEPGLTRDPTYGWIRHQDLDVQLVDTAGWKKATAMQPTQGPTVASRSSSSNSSSSSSSSSSQLGRQPPSGGATGSADASAAAAAAADGRLLGKQLADASLAQARRALSACHVAVLLLDAPRLMVTEQALTRLELQLAGMVIDQGKALVVALNKSDAVPGGQAAAADLQAQVAELLEDRFLPAGRLPVLLLSAQQNTGTDVLLDAVADAYAKWNRKVSSHKLRATLAKHSVRFFGTGGTASLLGRVKWAVQLKPRPPTFVLLLRGSEPVNEGGQRFLSNMLRASLKLQGVPLRLYLRYNKRYRDTEHTAGAKKRRRQQRQQHQQKQQQQQQQQQQRQQRQRRARA